MFRLSNTFIVLSVGSLVVVTLVACTKTDPDIVAGETVFNQTCKVCHASGINGAPIVGNKTMWRERATQGEAVLTQHAVNGYGLMPAKGGNTSLSDEQVNRAVKYFLSRLDGE